jgi:hypothetical protein
MSQTKAQLVSGLSINASAPATAFNIDASGRCGIGTTPSTLLHIQSTDPAFRFKRSDAGTDAYGELTADTSGLVTMKCDPANAAAGSGFRITVDNSEALRVDDSRRLLVGTSSTDTSYYDATTYTPHFQFKGSTASSSSMSLTRTDGSGPVIWFQAGASGQVPGINTFVGGFAFSGYDGANYRNAARIEAFTDAATGSGDMPGRLVFSTTADGASSPTERMRIRADGSIEMGKADSGDKLAVLNAASQGVISAYATNASYAATATYVNVSRAANTAYSFIKLISGDFADTEFHLRGDGNAFADGTWSGGGADYAEYFEWSDGNPDEEDRRGISVVLDGNQIRPAVDGEDPIGVISGNPSVVGDAAWNKWSGKYLRDDYGTYILEDYEVVNDEGETVIQQRRKLNPAYDPDQEYVNREDRPEWDCVGLMGKLRIRKGQPTGSRWIKMRDISDSVEEWLVR